MACYTNIEDRYRLASLRERQMHHVWAATAAAVVSVAATGTAAVMQSQAASKAAKGQAAAAKKAQRQERKALKGFQKGQAQIESELGQIQSPVMDIGADIADAERITGYNIAQLERLYPGAANQRQLASLAITDMIQGKLPQSVVGETMREVAQRGGAGFNIATAGRGALPQAPQYDYARAIGATSYGVMQQGLAASQNWQSLAGQFIQSPLQVSQNRLSYQMGAANVGLQKVGIKADLLSSLYGKQTEQTGRELSRRQEAVQTTLAREQQLAESIQKMGESASSAGSAAAGAYSKYAAAKGGGIVTGYGGQQFAPQTSATGGEYYAPIGGFK